MITARILDSGSRLRLQVRGHAGAAPRGEDLVCAAATALVRAAARAAEELYRQGKLRRAPEICLESGLGQVTLLPGAGEYAPARQLMQTLRCGFSWLAEEFPQCVRLEEAGAMQNAECGMRNAE